MTVLLIAPSKEEDLSRKTDRMVRFPQISLLYVAALTPPQHEVTVVEEEIQPLDLDAACDLVGITCMTATAARAYQIADGFRLRGKKVVMGGVHASVCPEEAKRHCDSVVVGEAEPVWAAVLEDAERGTLQPFYRGGTDWDLDAHPLPRRESGVGSTILGLVPVVTSRGCPYACDFCCVHNVYGRRIRHVAVRRVIEDIERAKASRVMFLDDNIVGDEAYARELFDALRATGIQWVGQASISFVRNAELLDLAGRSGCKGLFIGLESVSETFLARLRKSMKSLDATSDAMRRIMEQGILIHASLVFGFDDDDPSVFDKTLDYLARTKVPSATFNVLTPYPGTALFDRMKAENRLLTEDWRFYDHCTPTFVPRNMSIQELVDGYLRVKKSFYGLGGILRRYPANRRTTMLFWLINMGLKMGLAEEPAHIRSRIAQLEAMGRGGKA